MTATVDELNARLDALDRAIASGVLTVRHGETSSTYRSLAEMERARQLLKSDIATAGGTTRTRRPGYVYHSGKGL